MKWVFDFYLFVALADSIGLKKTICTEPLLHI